MTYHLASRDAVVLEAFERFALTSFEGLAAAAARREGTIADRVASVLLDDEGFHHRERVLLAEM